MGRRRGTNRTGVVLLACLVVLLAALIMFERNLAPVLAALARRQAEVMGVEAVSRALGEHLAGQVEYNDLILLQHDHQGQVAFMQLNTVAVHRLVANLQSTIQRELKVIEGQTFDIPLGQALGSDLFAAYGPAFRARMLPFGTVRVMLDQAFQHAGINQTRHTVYLTVETRVQVVVPLQREDMVVTTRTPLVEAVIVGPVPTHYLNLDWSLFPWAKPPGG